MCQMGRINSVAMVWSVGNEDATISKGKKILYMFISPNHVQYLSPCFAMLGLLGLCVESVCKIKLQKTPFQISHQTFQVNMCIIFLNSTHSQQEALRQQRTVLQKVDCGSSNNVPYAWLQDSCRSHKSFWHVMLGNVSASEKELT